MLKKKEDKSIYTLFGNKYGLSPRIIEVICNHPFMFAKERIADDEDNRPIMFGYLFKIKLKNRYLNEADRSKRKDTDED